MAERLSVALIGGGMYDALYRELDEFQKKNHVLVDVKFRGGHPELNAHLASLDEMTYDLVSTHSKYAPSQLRFLAPLNGFANELDTQGFYASALALATIRGELYSLPRNIDIKLLHYRPEHVRDVPADWEGLAQSAARISAKKQLFGFVFTGCESGLFGMFYELSEMAGAELFPAANAPQLDNSGGKWALKTIRDLYRSGAVPESVEQWHYQEAHDFFRAGKAAMVCDWPGYYADYRFDPTIRLARMPAGPAGVRKAYSGSHSFALTTRGVGKPAAVALLRFLTSPARQLIDARQGSVPVRPAVMNQIRAEASTVEADRLNLLDCVIANDAIIPPKLPYYPAIENILWHTVRSAMKGEILIEAALESMEQRITKIHENEASLA